MLSQLSYFPTWTPQRGVARCVCHSLAAVKSFLCTGHPSVRKEEPAIRDMQGPVATKPAPASGGHARTSDRQDGEGVMFAARSGCLQSVFSLVCRQASSSFPGTPAGKQGRSESGRHSNALPARTHRGIPGPCLPAGNPHATPDKARGIPGSSPSAIPEKNRPGRPCGAWLPRKKTL